MQISGINQTPQSTSFQKLYISKSNMPEDVFSAIKHSKTFNKFGSMYNANICYSKVKSSTKQDVIHPALIIDNITPANAQTKIVHLFKPIPKFDFMYFLTRGSKNEELVHKITNVDFNEFMDEFYAFLKR